MGGADGGIKMIKLFCMKCTKIQQTMLWKINKQLKAKGFFCGLWFRRVRVYNGGKGMTCWQEQEAERLLFIYIQEEEKLGRKWGEVINTQGLPPHPQWHTYSHMAAPHKGTITSPRAPPSGTNCIRLWETLLIQITTKSMPHRCRCPWRPEEVVTSLETRVRQL